MGVTHTEFCFNNIISIIILLQQKYSLQFIGAYE